MLLFENIDRLMLDEGISNQKLADYISEKSGEKVSRESVRRWRYGENFPPIDKAQIIAEYFDLSLDELMGKPLHTERMIRIPLVGAVNAGYFSIENDEEWRNRFCSVSLRLLAGRPKKECVALEVVGESMMPDLQPGDILVVHKQEMAYNGNIVIAYDAKENGYTVKRFYRMSDTVILDPINKNYPQIKYKRPSWKDLSLYGVCVGLERNLV